MSDNYVELIGNVTRDPELRFLSSGVAQTGFGIAVNRRWKNKQTDQWDEAVSFFDVVTWRELAENVAESVTKGTRVIVTGRLEQRSWENDDGQKRSKVEVVADDVGPSLRWATAQVTRTERSDATVGAQAAPKATYKADEEPFAVDAADWWPQAGVGAHPARMLP